MPLRIASWNPGGLKRRCKNKDFIRLCEDLDILILQETFVHKSTRQANVPGFQLFRRDAVKPSSGRPIGGLGVLVSFSLLNSFSVEEIGVDFCSAESLLLKFSRLPGADTNFPDSFFVFDLYIPPHPHVFDFAVLRDQVLPDLLAVTELSPVVFAGDFNCHAPSRSGGFSRLVDFLTEEGFFFFPERSSPVPTFVSHKGSSVIDFCFLRGFDSRLCDFSIFPFEAFGHRVIKVSCSFPPLSGYPLRPRS